MYQSVLALIRYTFTELFKSGVSPSTVYSMLNAKSMNPGVISLQKLCDGLDISLRTFFDSPLFEGLEQEIK